LLENFRSCLLIICSIEFHLGIIRPLQERGLPGPNTHLATWWKSV
jgi:hypothetical protein